MFLPAIALLVAVDVSGCGPEHVRRSEEVVFFPTAASRTRQGHWEVPVHGWLFEPERDSLRRWLIVELLCEALDLEDHHAETPMFRRRARVFLVDNEKGRRIAILFGKHKRHVGRTTGDGHFHNRFVLTDELVREMTGNPDEGILHYRALTQESDSRSFEGRVYLIEPAGYSVISDIDDTIKISEVGETDEVLENTFLRKYEAVPRMARLYQHWAGEGASFHYVSASPWQLYGELQAFMHERGFPDGSFHLRRFDWDEIDLWDLSPIAQKSRAIEELFKRYPQRKFVLVGDSGQKDPEIYGEFARRYPKQIEYILIRDLEDVDKQHNRYRRAFRGVPRDRWHVFHDPSEVEFFRPGMPRL